MDSLTALKADFRNFIYLAWTKALQLPEPSPLQYSIAYELQHGWKPGADGITRRQMQAARGFAKTYILCAWACWRLLNNPDLKILFISMNAGRAMEAVRLMRQIIDGLDVLMHLRPRPGQRDGANRFDVGAVTRPAKDPSLSAYGVMSAVAGTHPDIIIADDTETKENSLTAKGRERLMAAYHEFESMIQPGGEIVHMGTPQSGDSCYNSLAQHYELKRWPCRFPHPDDPAACKNIAPWCLHRVLSGAAQPGEPTYPERFGEEQLNEKLAVYGPYVFSLQMMLDTNLADIDRFPLKARNCIVMDCHPDRAPTNVIWGSTYRLDIRCDGMGTDGFYGPSYVEGIYEPYQKSVMFVDPAGAGSDKTGVAVVKGLHGMLYVLEVLGLEGGHGGKVMESIAASALRWGIKHIIVESNFGDGMYEKLLAPVVARVCGHVRIEGRKIWTQKEKRICDSLEPVTCAHRLVLNTLVAQNRDLVFQMTHITRDRGCLDHEDELDALAGAVSEFLDHLSLVPENEEKKRRQQELEKEVKEFFRDANKNITTSGWAGRAVDASGKGLPARLPRGRLDRMRQLRGRRRSGK